MIGEAPLSIVFGSPWLRKLFWKRLYQLLAWAYRNPAWTFMNYGYAPFESAPGALMLDPQDEPDRSFIQLYHHVLYGRSLSGKDVLEVGCGRGGGCSFIARYLRPHFICGVDFSRNAVKFCQERHRLRCLRFVVGDCENLPFPGGTFDAVVSVESSHCYPSFPRFLNEVRRVLRPGGTFHFADLRDGDQAVGDLRNSLQGCGLAILEGEDITRHVLAALREDGERRQELFRKTLWRPVAHLFQWFSGNAGSEVRAFFESRRRLYFSYLLQKI
jgi:SAM-dependent methyltransferase